MDMLDRYVAAIAKKLPRNMRADVAIEIRSTIEDMLADRGQSSSAAVDETMLSEVLRSYGSPERVAATYLPERYLIGPQLYPIFILVIKIVMTVLSVLALIGLGIGFAAGELTTIGIIKLFSSWFGDTFGGLIAAFGNIVLVFAVLERVLPVRENWATEAEAEHWDPADLLKEGDPDETSLWEPIVAVLFNFAALLIFNFYPELLRYTPSLNDWGSRPLVWFPFLSEAFFSYLPLLNVLWVATIILNLILVRRRTWGTGTRLLSIGLKIFTIYILFNMLRGPSLFNLSPEALASWPGALDGLKTLAGFFETLFRWVLGLAIFGTVIDLIKESYRLVTRPDSLGISTGL